MKRLRTARASKAETIRLDPDAERIVTNFADTCGWSRSSVVNSLLKVGYSLLRGHTAQGVAFQAKVDAAVRLYLARKTHEAAEAELRRKEREAAAQLKPPHLAEITVASANPPPARPGRPATSLDLAEPKKKKA